VSINVVSSAKSFVTRSLITKARSLMKIKKNNGPKTEPCGTPSKIFNRSDKQFLILTFCFLFLK
jgi:hypothetical protein